jgi:hypothetical protein
MVTQLCPARDDMCELQAIYDFIVRNVRYTGDVTGRDTYQSALTSLQFGGGDCFPLATTKIICRSKSTGQYELVRLGDLRLAYPAYEALSYNFSALRYEFRPIVAFQDKGEREVLKARLSNGTDLVATADHGFWALDGAKPKEFKQNLVKRTLGGYLESRAENSVNGRTARTRILQAARIPTLDAVECSESLAYLSGIYGAEGYSEGSHVCVAQSKPEIRVKIETALAANGASFRFQPPRAGTMEGGRVGGGAYYALRAGDVKEALKVQGSNSFDMQLSMALLSGSRSTVAAVMKGYEDGDAYHPKPESVWAKKVSAIYATSSDVMAEQLRFGFLLLGKAFNVQYQQHHGGSGKRPIWRLHDWKSSQVLRREEVLRDVLPGLRYGYVQSVEPAGKAHVGCITVDETHNFVLADGTIASNCDDHTGVGAVLAQVNGFSTKARITSNTGASWDHIYLMAGLPKHNPKRWIALDTTLGPGKFGREPPRAKFQDFPIGEL